MTDPKSEIVGLAERCEKAMGPDRLLDADIYTAVVGCLHKDREVKVIDGDPDDDEDFSTFSHQCKNCGEYRNMTVDPPVFTASLDAAMTLVCGGMVRLDWTIPKTKAFAALKFKPSWSQVSERIEAEAATPALALCAAALRARATLKEHE